MFNLNMLHFGIKKLMYIYIMVFKKNIFTNIKIYLECIIELRIKKLFWNLLVLQVGTLKVFFALKLESNWFLMCKAI